MRRNARARVALAVLALAGISCGYYGPPRRPDPEATVRAEEAALPVDLEAPPREEPTEEEQRGVRHD